MKGSLHSSEEVIDWLGRRGGVAAGVGKEVKRASERVGMWLVAHPGISDTTN